MKLEHRLRQAILSKGIAIEKLSADAALHGFLDRFRSKYVACDMVRIGGAGDGGYLLPNNLADIAYCFSPGVDYTATFERELSASYGIKSFMADASVASAPVSDDNFEFVPKYLGARTHGQFVTLSDWIADCVGDDTRARILQMDIEGAEYDVLTYESSETLAQFTTMVIEFHGLKRLFQPEFLRTFSAIFEKIYRNFSICHVHPNNCSGVATYKGVAVPRLLEITFVRNDVLEAFATGAELTLPHPLDHPNVAENEDIVLPEIWWRGP
ncbi:MAG: FkbM family methyltransferase [Pseudomonadota bacterium]